MIVRRRLKTLDTYDSKIVAELARGATIEGAEAGSASSRKTKRNYSHNEAEGAKVPKPGIGAVALTVGDEVCHNKRLR